MKIKLKLQKIRNEKIRNRKTIRNKKQLKTIRNKNLEKNLETENQKRGNLETIKNTKNCKQKIWKQEIFETNSLSTKKVKYINGFYIH